MQLNIVNLINWNKHKKKKRQSFGYFKRSLKYTKMFWANQISVLMYALTAEVGTLFIPATQFLPFKGSLGTYAFLACFTDKIF